MRPCVHERHQLVAFVLDRNFKDPRAFFHAQECGGVQGVHIGPNHILEVGIWKFSNTTKFIFGSDVYGTLRPGQVHDDQGIAIQIGFCTQHDFVFGSKKRHQDTSRDQQQRQKQASHETAGFVLFRLHSKNKSSVVPVGVLVIFALMLVQGFVDHDGHLNEGGP